MNNKQQEIIKRLEILKDERIQIHIHLKKIKDQITNLEIIDQDPLQQQVNELQIKLKLNHSQRESLERRLNKTRKIKNES